jgi:hypothetical protein
MSKRPPGVAPRRVEQHELALNLEPTRRDYTQRSIKA